jgi:hypothetical protein
MWQALVQLLLLAVGGIGEPEPRIENLHVTRQNGRILVSFQLLDALDEEMLERVQSGLPTELAFTLRLEHPRVWWFDRVFDRATLQVVAMYNAVTREYLVNYKLDGRLIESRVVTDLDRLQRAMTLIHSLPAFELADGGSAGAGLQEEPLPSRLQLTVRAQLGSKPFLFLFPNQIDTGWARSWLGEPLPSPLE